jgi:hypothetical protein
MKSSNLTNVLLGIIAICLLINTLKGIEIFPKAYANNTTNSKYSNFTYGMVPINKDGTIDVNIKSSVGTVDVDITDISTSDELDVNVEEVGGYSTYGKVPVEIKR